MQLREELMRFGGFETCAVCGTRESLEISTQPVCVQFGGLTRKANP